MFPDMKHRNTPPEEEPMEPTNPSMNAKLAARFFHRRCGLCTQPPLLKLVVQGLTDPQFRRFQAVTGVVSPRSRSSMASAARKTASQRKSAGIGSLAT